MGGRDLSSLSLSISLYLSLSLSLACPLASTSPTPSPPLSPQMMGTGMGNSSPVMQRPSNAEAGAVKVRDVPQNAPHALFLGCPLRLTPHCDARRPPHPTPPHSAHSSISYPSFPPHRCVRLRRALLLSSRCRKTCPRREGAAAFQISICSLCAVCMQCAWLVETAAVPPCTPLLFPHLFTAACLSLPCHTFKWGRGSSSATGAPTHSRSAAHARLLPQHSARRLPPTDPCTFYAFAPRA